MNEIALLKSPREYTPQQFIEVIEKNCLAYGLNLPKDNNLILINDFIKSNTFTLFQIDNALKLNLEGKFGKITKVFNAELTILFISEVLNEYKIYLDEIIKMDIEDRKRQADSQRIINEKETSERERELFKLNTIEGFKNGKLEPYPLWVHFDLLLREGLFQFDEMKLKYYEMKVSERIAGQKKLEDPFAKFSIEEKSIEKLAKAEYLKELIKK